MSHRLSVVNQKMEEKSVTKESQNRYSKAAKDWGWREFVTLTSLFDQDSGFLVQDTVIFSAEVLILKETSVMQDFNDQDMEPTGSSSLMDKVAKKSSFTWKVENFLSFKEIMETRKIFSKFFQAGGCELRIGKSFTSYLGGSLAVCIFFFKLSGVFILNLYLMVQVCMSPLTPFASIWRVTNLLVVIQIKTFGSDTKWP